MKLFWAIQLASLFVLAEPQTSFVGSETLTLNENLKVTQEPYRKATWQEDLNNKTVEEFYEEMRLDSSRPRYTTTIPTISSNCQLNFFTFNGKISPKTLTLEPGIKFEGIQEAAKESYPTGVMYLRYFKASRNGSPVGDAVLRCDNLQYDKITETDLKNSFSKMKISGALTIFYKDGKNTGGARFPMKKYMNNMSLTPNPYPNLFNNNSSKKPKAAQ